MKNISRHGEQIEALGLHSGVTSRIASAEGSPRFVCMVVTEGGRQVAFFRCEEDGAFAGWGWVEHANGQGRREFSSWAKFFAALETKSRAVA